MTGQPAFTEKGNVTQRGPVACSLVAQKKTRKNRSRDTMGHKPKTESVKVWDVFLGFVLLLLFLS